MIDKENITIHRIEEMQYFHAKNIVLLTAAESW